MGRLFKRFTTTDYKKATELAREYNVRYAAEIFGVDARTIRKWRADVNKDMVKEEFTFEDIPTGNEPIGDLIENRIKKYALKRNARNAENLINVKINVDGPVGIAHFGDPHIDDDGTNIAELLMHADLIQKTEGMFGGNIGDNQNNWIGRLARLYGEQSTSAKESWRLTEHFISKVDWL
jgi:transposase-like protein